MYKRHSVTQACDRCKKSKKRCNGEEPCSRCQLLGFACEYVSENNKRGRKPGKRPNSSEVSQEDPTSPKTDSEFSNLQQLLMLNSKLKEELDQQRQRAEFWERKYLNLVRESNPKNSFSIVLDYLSAQHISLWLRAFHEHVHPFFSSVPLPTETELQNVLYGSCEITGKRFLYYVILTLGARLSRHTQVADEMTQKIKTMADCMFGSYDDFLLDLDAGVGVLLLFKPFFPLQAHYSSNSYEISQKLQNKFLKKAPYMQAFSEYEQFFHYRSLLNQLVISEDFEDSSYFFQKAKQMQPTGFELILLYIFQFRNILRKTHSTALQTLDSNYESLLQWERTEPNQTFYQKLFLSVRLILLANRALVFWRGGFYEVSLSVAREASAFIDDARFNHCCVFACFAVMMIQLVFVCCNYTPGIEKCFQSLKVCAEVMPFLSPFIDNVKEMKQKEEFAHFFSFMNRFLNMDEFNMPRHLSNGYLLGTSSPSNSTPTGGVFSSNISPGQTETPYLQPSPKSQIDSQYMMQPQYQTHPSVAQQSHLQYNDHPHNLRVPPPNYQNQMSQSLHNYEVSSDNIYRMDAASGIAASHPLNYEPPPYEPPYPDYLPEGPIAVSSNHPDL
eukprot:TRINITY_DN12489_c0_g1_i1.p1 TRINITY_DN12489_c0_g1~~TRINITY_DN12489_c0_g1_i1.p1  ORF type:complete len:614 (+),score=103.91 TRINITY_DN12489_c0_g1_i1:51-1892(+)